jgi:DNA-binding MarR family transcriptional regulator
VSSISRLSDRLESRNRSGAAQNTQVAALVDQISRALAELQAFLEPTNSSGPRTSIPSTMSPDAEENGLQVVGGINLKINVRAAKNLRHLRRKMFGEDFFSGPAWSILLQLFEARILQRTETVGQVSLGAEVPCATVLRWLNKLRKEGLVHLRDDHLDKRRRFVELSDAGAHLMMEYFSGAAPHLDAA